MSASRFALPGAFFLFSGAVLLSTPACSGSSDTGLFGSPTDPAPADPDAAGLGQPLDPDGGAVLDDAGCQGAGCNQVACADGKTTTLSGKVYDPAGANTLYNVVVYVPTGPLPALKTGAGCDTCGTIDAVVKTRTDADGRFVLRNVPVGKDVPVVVQTGKWRRRIEVDVSKACADNKVADKTLRLPKNGGEGDMPHIAVTAGGCDALECLLRGIGVDDAEFVPGASNAGHIHVFNGDGGKFTNAPAAGGSADDPGGGALWNSAAKMKPYDSVLLSCECGEETENKGGPEGTPGARQSMRDYANAGGRVVATHYHYTWMRSSPSTDWQQIANWNGLGGSGTTGNYDVDTSFPGGAAFGTWLKTNGAGAGSNISLSDVTASLSTIKSPAQRWVHNASSVKLFSFPAPLTGAACGRVAFSDLHVMGISGGGTVFPNACPVAGGLNAQQKALEFQLFEMSACAN